MGILLAVSPAGRAQVPSSTPAAPASAPASLYQPGTTAAYSCASPEQVYPDNDPILNPPPLPGSGWLADVDLGISVPHVKNKLTDTVQVGTAVPSTVALPSAPLNWTVAPREEFGYRMPDGFGAISISYRFMATDGTQTGPGPDATALLSSRFEMNIVDLDYSSQELSIWPPWIMKWRVGLRGGDLFFASSDQEPFAAAAAGSMVFAQSEKNNFWGIGPHAGLELDRRWPDSGFAFITRFEGATLLGRIHQDFMEQFTIAGSGGQLLVGQTHESGSQNVPTAQAFVGLGWTPPSRPCLHFEVGYQYEYWWNVGRLNSTSSLGEVSDQGVLLRAELNY